MGFLSAYLLFIAKAVTVLIFILISVAAILAIVANFKKKKRNNHDELDINYLNDELEQDKIDIDYFVMDKSERKAIKKSTIKPEKDKPRLFILDFNGDIHASETDALRREITAIIQAANPEKDEVLLRLESPGGVVHGYGLASSQLARLNNANIKLTISVDKVAASGGYMMASVAHKIIAAPFAIVGSIGVVAQLPNINRLLKDKKVDIELHTAGEYKRTLTMLGENTTEGREKFQEELELTHTLFKNHIKKYRPSIDINQVSTGETWYGQQAIDNKLIDDIQTSDDYILSHLKSHDIYTLGIEENMGIIQQLKDRFMKTKSTLDVPFKYFL